MTMTRPTQDKLARSKQRALLVAVVSTFLSLIPTAYATLLSNSVILLTDLLRCLVEFCAILLSWLILRHVSRSDSSRFNYGYGKLEQISSIAVAVAMLGTFLAVMISALLRILSPQPVENAGFGFVLGILSILGNVTLWRVNYSLAKQSASAVMESQWRLFRAKSCASIIVVASLLPSMFGPLGEEYWWTDPLGSLILAGFLLYSAMGMFSSSMRELLDSSLEEGLQLVILKTLVQFESEYRGFRSMRSRRSGNKVFIELFLEFEPSLSIEAFSAAAARMTDELHKSISGSEVTIVPSVAD